MTLCYITTVLLSVGHVVNERQQAQYICIALYYYINCYYNHYLLLKKYKA